MRKFTFEVTFADDQDVESHESDVEYLYVLLEQLREDGVLKDYNCSEMGGD